MYKKGNKKISELNYNDEILTHVVNIKKILNIIAKDISKIITIKVNGNKIICSEDHKFIVFRDDKVQEMKPKDIKYTDFFLLKDKN